MRLVATDLEIARGEEIILTGVNLHVGSGESLVVTGPNGGGKSTLLRALAGLLPLRHGRVSIEQADGSPSADLGSALHYLGHENAMKADISTGDNLAFWHNLGPDPHLSPEEALDMVGLGGLDAVPFGHLSTGQRRRAAIARLLVTWRPVWLLDEPTAGLDAASQAGFSELVAAHLDDGGIVVAATHVPLGIVTPAELNVADFAPAHLPLP